MGDARTKWSEIESGFRVCGHKWEDFSEGWESCKGTWPNTRGYTCGLWLLMHSVLANAAEDVAVGVATALRDFVTTFFGCNDCRLHFKRMSEGDEKGIDSLDQVSTRRGAALWFWRAHNAVNKRVGALEAAGDTGDPHFPKHPWPSKQACANCYRWDGSPDESKVARYLDAFFGHGALSLVDGADDTATALGDVVVWLVAMTLAGMGLLFILRRRYQQKVSPRSNGIVAGCLPLFNNSGMKNS